MLPPLLRRIAPAAVIAGVLLSTLAIGAASGAPSSTSTSTSTSSTSTSFADEPIVNTSVNDELLPLGRGRMAEQGSQSYTLYRTRFGWKPYAYVRDASSTSTSASHVALPEDAVVGGWEDASYAVSASNELWVLSGNGPVRVRRYRLSGSPLPSSATLLSTTTFGDTNSRAGALTILSSGTVVGVWHQQDTNGLGIVSWSPVAGWSSPLVLDFMPTMASKQALVQHPADGSVWLFNNPDAWHGIGVAHLSETGGGLRVDWTDESWIDVEAYGDFGPDPENPDLAVSADAADGSIVLAYQGNARRVFSTSPVVIGSQPVLARIRATGAPSFVRFPTYVERISSLGVVARAGEVWLAHRPIDQATSTYTGIAAARYDVAAAGWDAAVPLGTAYDAYGRIGYGVTRVEFTARLSDARIHRFASGAVASSPSTPTGDTTTTTAPTSTTTTKTRKSSRR